MPNAPTTFLNDYSPVGIVIDKPDATSYSQTGLQIQASGETGGADAGNNPISLSQLQGGNYNGIFIVAGGQIQSPNFVTGVSGWQILSNGNVEFNSGTFRGALSANSIDIPNTTTANSFHVDSLGNTWWGATTFGSAIASVSKAGAATFTNISITGGSISGTTTVGVANLNLANRGFSQTCSFSIDGSTPSTQVDWTSGAFTSADATVYNIQAGNTGVMAAKTFVYLDSGMWTTFGSFSNVGGQLTANSQAGTTNYAGYKSTASFNFTGQVFSSQLINAGDQTLTSFQAVPVQIFKDSSNTLTWIIGTNTLIAQKQVAGVFTTLRSDTAYNSTTHKYFRIRESAGTTFWDYSTDSSSWTNYTSLANPFAITSVQYIVQAGTFSSEATSTSAIFDNFFPYLVTTTATSSIGSGKVLIATAQNNTTEAVFQVLTGQGGQNIDASTIVASSITANEIAASTITGTNIATLNISGKNATFDTGTVGGFTMSASTLSATNFTVTAGAANTANLSVGSGNNVAGLNSANAANDVAIWAGSSYANRATAPFRVVSSGTVYATGVVIIGSSAFVGITSNQTTGMLSVFGDVNLPLVSGVQGTEPTGYTNNTGAAGTLTSKIGLLTLALSGTAAAGEVGIEAATAFIDLSKNAIFAIDFKFNQFTFTGSASDSTMLYTFLCGNQGSNRRSCFGIKATATGSGAQTLVFSVVNYNTSGTETATVVSPTVNVTNKLICIYQPSVKIQFYLNGVLVATSTTNLPQTTDTTSELLRLDGQVQNSNVSSPPTVTISRFHVTGTGLG